MKIISSAFAHNEKIPSKYTCDGDNISPPLQFTEVPSAAKSLALLVEDPDAPSGLFVHWVIYNIPVSAGSLPEGARPPGIEGVNDFGKSAYGGPCPPSGTHRYYFKFFALDSEVDLPEGVNRSGVLKAMKGHIIEEDELIGLYQRG